ncbi:MAG: hypothetical protein NC318_10130 [Blautia sp.]|nr:hypothetical protein [Lachnoclostridium sp.]MCM1211950.1 hypothetical protein [Blautia sp.]
MSNKKFFLLYKDFKRFQDYKKIQLVTISRPSAYGEYEPYHFVDTEAEFEQAVKRSMDKSCS